MSQQTTAYYKSRLKWAMWSYLIGFLVCLLIAAVLEKRGVANIYLGYMFIALPLVGYALIGMASRPTHLSDYYVAGRSVPALYNGMATAADWMSAASFVGMAGSLFLLGYDGLVWILGWTAGFVVLAVLIVPYFRKSGAITVPDFLAARYQSTAVRLLSVIVVLTASFAYLVAQIYGCGIIMARFVGVSFEVGIWIGFISVLLCCVVGGMRAVTWTQTTQCVVMLVAYLAPLIMVSVYRYGLPVPFITYGQALEEIAVREGQLVKEGLAVLCTKEACPPGTLRPHVMQGQTYTLMNFFGIAITMMVGTTVMPHIITRYATTPSVREARISVVWTLFFILLLYCAAPAYAAFAKLEVYSTVIGRALSDLPAWIFSYGELELIQLCGKNAVDLQAVTAACKAIAGHPGVVRLQDFVINTDVIVMATPEFSGTPYFIAALLATGGLAAALSTADGLLIALSIALSHDLYYKTIDPMAPPRRRLFAARTIIVVVVGLAAFVASTKPADILAMVGWTFSLAGSGLFPVLVLSIWWKRANKAGAIVGMLAGFLTCLSYLLVTRYFPGFGVKYLGMTSLVNAATGRDLVDVARVMASPNAMESWAGFAHPMANRVGWFGLNNISAAILAVPVGLFAAIVVSALTSRPPLSQQEFVENIRRPDEAVLSEDLGEDRVRL